MINDFHAARTMMSFLDAAFAVKRVRDHNCVIAPARRKIAGVRGRTLPA